MPVVLQKGSGTIRGNLGEVLVPGRPGGVVVIVPTKRKIRHLTRELIGLYPRGVAAAFPIHTLESFARSIYRTAPGVLRSVSGPMQTALFDRAVRLAGPAFRYFSPRGRDGRLFPGTFERVVDVVSHLKESGVTPEVLGQEAVDAPADERAKTLDVAAIFRAYNEALKASKAEDLPGIIQYLGSGDGASAFRRVFRSAFPEAFRLLLAGFDEFTAPEVSLLKNVCTVEGLTISLLFDFQHGNPALFGHLEDNYARFVEMGFREVQAPSGGGRGLFSAVPGAREGTDSLTERHLGRRLFIPAATEPRLPSQGRVTIVRARSRVEEVAIICRLIRSLVAEQPGRDLSRIAVTMVRPQLYTEIFREQFRRYGIPANITDRYDLVRSPVVSALYGILLVALRDFRRDDVLRVASTPYGSFREDDTSLDAAALAEVSKRLRITGGLRVWRSRIRDRKRVLSGALDSRIGNRNRDHELAMLDRVLTDLEAMERVLSVFATPLTPSAFAGAFERLCDSLRVPLHLVYRGAEADREHVERDVRAWVRLMEIVRETMAAAAEERPAGEPLPLRQHTEMVRLALLRERYNVREEFGRGVLVTSIDETRGLPVEVMFVAGLVDGEFPSVYQTEVFLSVRRQRIREQRHNWRNRYLFYQAVTNWSDRLYLTYPDSDGDVDFVRSPFVDAFLAAVEADEWNGGAGTPLEATLWSPDDALRWFASRRTAGSGIPASLQNRLEKVRFAAAVERSRAGFHDRPGYEGILGSALSERCLHVLRERRDEVYSISELETYQACPFRYMAEHLLRLFVPEDFREDLSAVERGSLLHEALRRFFTDRRTRGMPPLAGCSEETFEAALHDLKSVLEEELAVHTIPDPFWEVDRQILLGEESGTGGIARAFLEAERSRLVETTPAYFEAAFGGARGPGADDLLSTEEPLRLGGVLLRGRIDRVETGDGFYAVMDYKTGRELPGRADLEAGLSLQLPVYLGAAGELLGERGGHPAAALYCQLRDQARFVVALADRRYGGRAFLTREGTRRPVLEEPEFRGLIDSAYRTLGRAVEGIASARFPLTEPHLVKRVCTFCPYSLMCRIQSSRKVTPTEPEEQ